MLLEAKDLNVYYGAIHALQGVRFTVDEGEIVSLIGANGAGKSTTLKTVSGLLHPRVGDVLLRGEVVDNDARAGYRASRRDPRAGRPKDLRTAHRPGEPGDGRVHAQRIRPRSEQSMERVFKSFPRLKERLGQLGGTLSGGEQQMLAIGRGLMAKPEAAAAGRALHGPGAHPGRGDLRDHPGDQRAGGERSCWWSRTR